MSIPEYFFFWLWSFACLFDRLYVMWNHGYKCKKLSGSVPWSTFMFPPLSKSNALGEVGWIFCCRFLFMQKCTNDCPVNLMLLEDSLKFSEFKSAMGIFNANIIRLFRKTLLSLILETGNLYLVALIHSTVFSMLRTIKTFFPT